MIWKNQSGESNFQLIQFKLVVTLTCNKYILFFWGWIYNNNSYVMLS